MTSLTLWPSLYETSSPEARTFKNLSELEEFFSAFITTDKKDSAPGFGPYTLRPGGSRRDSDVLGLTCGVFDVDTFQDDPSTEMVATVRALVDAKVSHFWYSTFSHSEEKPSFRLVVPFTSPIPPSQWPQVRAHMLATFSISADPKKCSGASHFYYMPTHKPGAEPSFAAYSGDTYQPPEFPKPPRKGPLFQGQPSAVVRATGPVDIQPLRTALEKRASSLSRSHSPDRKKKGDLLKRLLKGESLGQHGERNQNTFITAGVMAWALPVETPIEAMSEIFRQSLETMQAEGSSLTEEIVERAIITSAEKHSIAEDSDRKLKEFIKGLREANNPSNQGTP